MALKPPTRNDGDCDHPGWAKERTTFGTVVCRICNPRPLDDHGRMFY